jgi:hypothetical protein
MELATQNYRDFREMFGVPVRITRGAKRFKTEYELAEKAPLLYPPKELFGRGLPADTFDAAYQRNLLVNVGYPNIRRELEDIAARHPGRRLVLLCFEKVLDGEECHRRSFAKFWESLTGEAVPEIAVDVNTKELLFYSDEQMPVEYHNRGIVGPIF